MYITTFKDISHSSEKTESAGKVEKNSGKRIGYNYIILKSLKESQKNDVIKCLYIKSLTNFGICVIKEGTFGDLKDKNGRDIKDRLLWQKYVHEKLQDKLPIPRLLGSFEENGNFYLVLEKLNGKSLYEICRDNNSGLNKSKRSDDELIIVYLDYLLQIISILELLHQQQFVHRDITSSNFIVSKKGKVSLIDFELSYSFVNRMPSPPFELGTYGYMSPEQKSSQEPTKNDDVFSLGAIMFEIFTGISPNKLTDAPPEVLTNRAYFFIPDKILADQILLCLHAEASLRPPLESIAKILRNYKNDLQRKVERPHSPEVVRMSDTQIKDVIQQLITTCSSPMLTSSKGWFSESVNKQDVKDNNRINKEWYVSFNRGASGIIYLLSKAKSMGFDIDSTKPFIDLGLQLIREKYIPNIKHAPGGLHFGSAGIAACLSVAMQEKVIEQKEEYLQWLDTLLGSSCEELGIMHGVAGQYIAYQLCRPFLQDKPINKNVQNCIDYLIQIQDKDGAWCKHNGNSKKNKKPIGFANGTAGITWLLLQYGQENKNIEAINCAQKAIKWLIHKSKKSYNGINWQSEKGEDIAPWWCEGAPGIALCFLKAYELFQNKLYKEYAIKALSIHDKRVIHNNLSQCHGLSGLGEVYLEAFKILKDEEWLDRADWILHVLMRLKKDHPDFGPYWLIQNEKQPVADFMIGNSGAIHFLLRFCNPEKLGFPLLP